MIYTKRQIKTNSDRYGGFAADEAERVESRIAEEPAFQTTEAKSNNMMDELLKGTATDKLVYDEPQKLEVGEPVSAAQKSENLYTTRETLNAPKAEVRQEHNRLSRLDIIPSEKTLRYADDRADLENVVPQKTRKASNMDVRTRVMLSVYIVVALALAVAVIATGVLIASANAQSEELVNAIAQKQEYIINQEATIGELTNEATVRDAAIKNGMVYADDPVYNANSLNKTDFTEPTEHTNGFDEFCDFISGI